MLIVSKFHDYYDTASVYGVDKTCVYQRSESEYKIERTNWDSSWFVKDLKGVRHSIPRRGSVGLIRQGDKKEWEIEETIVAFCGQFYPVISARERFGSKYTFFYDVEEFQEFVRMEGLFSNSRSRYYSPRWDKYNVEIAQGAAAFFNDVAELNSKCGDFFHLFRTPVFAIREKVILNPSLKNLGFMKVMDPQTTFQNIYMYLSGVLGQPVDKPKPIDDKIMAASKGHDGPYSFKKPPGKRGKNKWR